MRWLESWGVRRFALYLVLAFTVIMSVGSQPQTREAPAGGPQSTGRRRPPINQLKKLFPKFSNDLAYIDDSIIDLDKRTPNWKPPGLRELWKDLDGDGHEEYAFIAQWYQPGENIHSGRAFRIRQFLLGILRATPHGWSVLDYRYSGEMNIVVDAFLHDVPGGIEVLIQEGRPGQCDDAKDEQYALAWDRDKGAFKGPFPNKHLHPFPRDLDCGE